MVLFVVLAAVMTASFTGSHALAQTGTNSDTKIEQIVKGLGNTHTDVTDDLAVLKTDQHAAVTFLVGELHPIPRKVYFERTKTKDARHIVSCLQALHYLTGLTFTAGTESRLTDDETQFLDFSNAMHDSNPDHRLHFFGIWMSRDAYFVAPVDAQHKIIDQWKQWQNQYGNSFQYIPSGTPKDSIDHWYWFG